MPPFEKSAEALEREPRKQISIFMPLSEWRAIRREAARRNIPMTELCRGWMQADLEKLMNSSTDG